LQRVRSIFLIENLTEIISVLPHGLSVFENLIGSILYFYVNTLDVEVEIDDKLKSNSTPTIEPFLVKYTFESPI